MDLNTSKAVVALISKDRVKYSDNMGTTVSSIFINQFQSILNQNKYSLEEVLLYREDFSELFSDLCFLKSLDIIKTQHVKDILEKGWNNPYMDLVEYFVDSKLLDVMDEEILRSSIIKHLENNPKIVEQFKSGRTQVAGSIIGMLKKEFGNKFNPSDAMGLIKEQIDSI